MRFSKCEKNISILKYRSFEWPKSILSSANQFYHRIDSLTMFEATYCCSNKKPKLAEMPCTFGKDASQIQWENQYLLSIKLENVNLIMSNG